MNNAGEIWAVEWDPESKVPHIQLLKDTIVGNLRSIKSYDEKRLIPGYFGRYCVDVGRCRRDSQTHRQGIRLLLNREPIAIDLTKSGFLGSSESEFVWEPRYSGIFEGADRYLKTGLEKGREQSAVNVQLNIEH